MILEGYVCQEMILYQNHKLCLPPECIVPSMLVICPVNLNVVVGTMKNALIHRNLLRRITFLL